MLTITVLLKNSSRVVNILLEVAYRYLTTILEDAKLISGHAKKKSVDGDDIRLAVQVT